MWMSWPAWVILAPIHSTLLNKWCPSIASHPMLICQSLTWWMCLSWWGAMQIVPTLSKRRKLPSSFLMIGFLGWQEASMSLLVGWQAWIHFGKNMICWTLSWKRAQSPVMTGPSMYQWSCMGMVVPFKGMIPSMFSAANVGSSQLLLFAIPKGCIHKTSNLEEDTMHQVWKVLQWSFSYMFFGKHPDLGMKWNPKSWRASKAGVHLSESALHGWLFAITGDGEYFQNEFKLKGHSFNDCCFNCSPNKSIIPIKIFELLPSGEAQLSGMLENAPQTTWCPKTLELLEKALHMIVCIFWRRV